MFKASKSSNNVEQNVVRLCGLFALHAVVRLSNLMDRYLRDFNAIIAQHSLINQPERRSFKGCININGKSLLIVVQRTESGMVRATHVLSSHEHCHSALE